MCSSFVFVVFLAQICNSIIAFKPDVVCTEKGLSDLAQHYFVKHGITAFRRLRKTDNNRLARASGATIVSRADEIKEVCVYGLGVVVFLFWLLSIGYRPRAALGAMAEYP